MIIDSPIISGSYLSTGSLSQTGNVSITGSLTATAGVSGSFSGSGANLFDIPAAGIVGLNLSQIASGSVSASISPNQGLLINTSVSASNFTGSFTGSLTGIATSASYASFALTSSYSLGGSGFPFSGSAVITGSLIVSGSGLTITGSVAISTLTTGSGVRYVIADANGLVSAQTASAVIFVTQKDVATSGQTSFNIVNGYSTGYVTVFVNGTKLSADEYTDTSGTAIVLATGSMVNDVVEFQKYMPAAGVSNNVLRTTNYFTTTLGQTNFTVNYTPGLLDVFYNGSKLNSTEYTAANGTSITLATGSNLNDSLEVDVYSYQVGAFSGIGGVGVAKELAFYNTTNSITGSNKVTYDGSTFSITGSFLVTGSSTFTNIGPAVFSGSVTAVGGFSGSFSGNADSASLAQNSLLLQGTGSVGFTTTASFNAVSASQQQISSSQEQISASLLTLTASYTALSSSYTSLSASYTVFSGSASTRITDNSSSIQQVSSSQQQISSSQQQISASLLNVISVFATTGSNSFRANQSITGSLVVSSTITAQTLVVQTVTSSIVYSSGSNIFGSALTDRQTFTGSMNITGSNITANVGTACFSSQLCVGSSLVLGSNNAYALYLKDSAGNPKPVMATAGNTNLNFYNVCSTGKININNAADNAVLISIDNTGAACFASSVTATSLSIASNTGGITLNRTGTSNYSTILYQSAAADKWYVGMRENNATSDYILYNATNDTNTLRISVANNSATFSSTITGTTIYGSTAVCSPIGLFSGCVGIGTSTPAKPLEIRTGGSNTTPTQIFNGAIVQAIVAGEPQIVFSSNISPSEGIPTSTELARAGIGFAYISAALPSEFSIGIQCTNVCNSNVRFFNGVERMRITSAGTLMVGACINNGNADVSPIAQMIAPRGTTTYPLTLTTSGAAVGGDQIRMSFNYGVNWSATAYIGSCVENAGTAATGMVFGTYSGGLLESLRISSTGIACFKGTVCAPCFATISDYRMKSNIRPIEGLSIIMNTKPYKFEYNYDCSTSFGMIAHELQDTLPEAVFGQKDGEVMQGVDYMKLLPITIKAIQEQQCTINILKTCLGII